MNIMVPKMTSKFSVNFMEKYTLLLVLLDCIYSQTDEWGGNKGEYRARWLVSVRKRWELPGGERPRMSHDLLFSMFLML